MVVGYADAVPHIGSDGAAVQLGQRQVRGGSADSRTDGVDITVDQLVDGAGGNVTGAADDVEGQLPLESAVPALDIAAMNLAAPGAARAHIDIGGENPLALAHVRNGDVRNAFVDGVVPAESANGRD